MIKERLKELGWIFEKYILRNSLILRQIQGNKMYLDPWVPGISKELAIKRIYEPEVTELLKVELTEGMIVVDIGANIGYHTLIEASIVKGRGRVYAFEPDHRNFRLLEKNVDVNGYKRIVETYCLAVSDITQDAKIYLGERSDINTMLSPDTMEHLKGHKWDSIEVKCTSIDDFLKDKGPVNFIRMDINGYEVEVFKGMMDTIKNSLPGFKILFELHMHTYYEKNHSLQPILQRFFELGLMPKVLISTDESQAGLYRQLGYKPDKIVKNEPFTRGVYYNAKIDDVIRLTCYPPKSTKFMLLEKIG